MHNRDSYCNRLQKSHVTKHDLLYIEAQRQQCEKLYMCYKNHTDTQKQRQRLES